MAGFTKKLLETILKDTQEHLAETKRLGPGYYRIRERYDYAIESDERYIEKLRKQIAEYDQAALNENQQIVLEWLKKSAGREGSLMRALYSLYHLNLSREDFFKPEARKPLIEVRAALRKLTRRQEAEVLAAFAEWGKEEVTE